MIIVNLDKSIICEIIEICKVHNEIDKLVLFGSRARGDNEAKSDIDLAVYASGDINEFIEDVELNTSTLLEYDFSDMNSVEDEIFLEQVKKDGIVIYEKC